MSQNVWGIVSGLSVLVLGVLAVAGLVGPEVPPVEASPVVSQVPAPVLTVESTSVPSGPELPGVSSRISRVLEWNGSAGFADDDELAQLPPAVAAVLTQYGVPLRVPIPGGDG